MHLIEFVMYYSHNVNVLYYIYMLCIMKLIFIELHFNRRIINILIYISSALLDKSVENFPILKQLLAYVIDSVINRFLSFFKNS